MGTYLKQILIIFTAVVRVGTYLADRHREQKRNKKREDIGYDPVAYAKLRGMRINDGLPDDLRNGVPQDRDLARESLRDNDGV